MIPNCLILEGRECHPFRQRINHAHGNSPEEMVIQHFLCCRFVFDGYRQCPLRSLGYGD